MFLIYSSIRTKEAVIFRGQTGILNGSLQVTIVFCRLMFKNENYGLHILKHVYTLSMFKSGSFILIKKCFSFTLGSFCFLVKMICFYHSLLRTPKENHSQDIMELFLNMNIIDAKTYPGHMVSSLKTVTLHNLTETLI